MLTNLFKYVSIFRQDYSNTYKYADAKFEKEGRCLFTLLQYCHKNNSTAKFSV